MAKVLTAKAVEKLKPGPARREVPDAHTPGLYLVIQPSGRKSFAVRTRIDGKTAKLTLRALGLADARAEAAEIVKQVRAGTDPRTVAADAEAARPITFRELADAYLERWAKPRKKTWREDEADIKRDLLPGWGARTAASITRRDVLAVLEAKARTAPIRSNRLRALLHKLFGWAAEVDLLPASPAAGIKPLAPEQDRDRVLTDAELTALWRATARMGEVWGPYIRALGLTGQRLREVSRMERRHVDLDGQLWTLAATATKGKRTHEVPLVDQVAAIVRDAPEIVTDGKKGTVSPLVFTFDGRELRGFSKAKARLDGYMLEELRKEAKERDDNPEHIELEPWRFHDLRRTAASGMARMGFPPHVVAAILNHSPGSTQGITAIYNRYRYADEKRAALEAWAGHVLALVEARPANVVALPVRR